GHCPHELPGRLQQQVPPCGRGGRRPSPWQVKRVFIDSGGFFALLAAEDRFHDHARSLFSRANTERWRLVTTNAVVVETYSLLLVRSRGRPAERLGLPRHGGR